MPLDPTIAVYLSIVALFFSGFNTWILFKKGAITKDDMLLFIKVVSAIIPFASNPGFVPLINDIMHAFMERYKVTKGLASFEELLRKAIEQVTQAQQQQQPQQKPQQQPQKA